jgi:hypothetical protein
MVGPLNFNISGVSCSYAPANDAEEKKDDFYKQLQAVIDKIGAKDVTILMGNCNAKIGVDIEYRL